MEKQRASFYRETSGKKEAEFFTSLLRFSVIGSCLEERASTHCSPLSGEWRDLGGPDSTRYIVRARRGLALPVAEERW